MNQKGRKRVGLIVPSTNTVMEPDLYRHLPSEVTIHTARMMLRGGVTIEAEERMLDEYLPKAAQEISTLRPHLVVFGCTSAGALRGPSHEKEMLQGLSGTTGAPVISIMGAVEAQLRRLGARSVAVLTPYSAEVNETIRRSLEALGFQVVHIRGMDVPEAFRIADIAADQIVEYAREQMKGVEADCLFISCANLRALEAIGPIQKALGMPVVTSIQAVLEEVRKALDLQAPALAH
ncbi:MAG: aspartate/glutamate racemase family protein [Chloroflexi bacterium]|nr:aspartate/glutamate racemase family protein [Chloroflexota bacterium]